MLIRMKSKYNSMNYDSGPNSISRLNKLIPFIRPKAFYRGVPILVVIRLNVTIYRL